MSDSPHDFTSKEIINLIFTILVIGAILGLVISRLIPEEAFGLNFPIDTLIAVLGLIYAVISGTLFGAFDTFIRLLSYALSEPQSSNDSPVNIILPGWPPGSQDHEDVYGLDPSSGSSPSSVDSTDDTGSVGDEDELESDSQE